MKRIGLFGGTFNPIHFGHLRMAREVQEALDLERIIFIPSAIPPHKPIKDVASASDRLEMTRLAISGISDFIISEVEITRSGLSYTVDTIRYFLAAYPDQTQLYLIIGLDAFYEIHTWKSYLTLFSLVPVIVMNRFIQTKNKRNDFETHLNQVISNGYRFASELQAYVDPEKQPVYELSTTLLDISSTRIRRLIQEGKSIQFLTPVSVEDYIQRKGLYQ